MCMYIIKYHRYLYFELTHLFHVGGNGYLEPCVTAFSCQTRWDGIKSSLYPSNNSLDPPSFPQHLLETMDEVLFRGGLDSGSFPAISTDISSWSSPVVESVDHPWHTHTHTHSKLAHHTQWATNISSEISYTYYMYVSPPPPILTEDPWSV